MAFDHWDFRDPDALERMDQGDRLALHMAQELMSIAEPQPEQVDKGVVNQTGSDLLDIRAALVVAASRFPLQGNEDVHQWFNALINGVDALAAELAGRGES